MGHFRVGCGHLQPGPHGHIFWSRDARSGANCVLLGNVCSGPQGNFSGDRVPKAEQKLVRNTRLGREALGENAQAHRVARVTGWPEFNKSRDLGWEALSENVA